MKITTNKQYEKAVEELEAMCRESDRLYEFIDEYEMSLPGMEEFDEEATNNE